MTTDQMINLFEQYCDGIESSAYVEPEDREFHCKEDLNAFLLLAKLDPDCNNLIAGADKDVIYFSTDPDQLASTITEDDIKNLVVGGVFYDTDTDTFSMFV